MLVIDYPALRGSVQHYCDLAADERETVVVTREDDKNFVLIGYEAYYALTKAARSAEYL